MTPYWTDGQVTLHHGDALDVLRGMPDASVDAVVTDPPYGLEFMGREWDRFTQRDPRTAGRSGAGAVTGGAGIGDVDESLPSRPSGVLFDPTKRQARGVSYGGKRPTTLECDTCGVRSPIDRRHASTAPKCPGVWVSVPMYPDAPSPLLPFQQWCTTWAVECLRVLKPGGHLLAFGGTRTWHRLACAIEDAGFEVRDSIAWLYGSGFPKSLDVGKAIDRARTEDRAPVDAVRSWLNEQRLAAGLSHDAINAHFGHARNGGGSSSAWMTNPTSRNLPTWEQWQALRDLLGFGGEMDAEVWRLNGRKGTPGEAWSRREVVGQRVTGAAMTRQAGKGGTSFGSGQNTVTDTAPATDDARTWQGWGTALKPAGENIVCAQKPLGLRGILDAIGSHLDRLEAACEPPANGAGEASPPTRPGSPEAKIVSAPVSAAIPLGDAPVRTTRTGAAVGSSAQTGMSQSESMESTCWNTVTSWRHCWVDLCALTSMSTTETTTDLPTLLSCLAQITPANIIEDPTSPAGLSSLAEAVDHLFAAAVLSWRATRALTATASATSETPRTFRGGRETIVLARKPLAGTVAANVLAYGTGALNVDACRVGDDTSRGDRYGSKAPGGSAANGYGLEHPEPWQVPAGRWPPNVLLDGDTADALDEQSGTLASGDRSGATRNHPELGDVYAGGRRPAVERDHLGDSGGASRFFPVFRYEAKAPTSERPRVNGGVSGDTATSIYDGKPGRRCNVCGSRAKPGNYLKDDSRPWPSCGHDDWEMVPTLPPSGNHVAHPTVKPLDLMRWLVRLVTPPGGLVLDPFAGSGTTGEACILEHFRAILIEREADYLPLILARLSKPLAVGFDFGEVGA